ncbi:signal peptidase I [Altererythrobacter soli]|uniref:Signal peptidase I n=1 Tax=Croceibacterium soli TaxID=1739690 RepID=A0A6I4UR06_9SPHN|nr:signal peptidase I [Croceibacterium soli]MXP41322.1 signal peptidase I [Croceibacterium soli]
MNDTATPPIRSKDAAAPAAAKKEEGSFLWFLIKLVIVVLVFRTFVFSTFSIPSESMLPRLMVGDYLFTAKWPYGYSRASLPFDIGPDTGRILGSTPERGDIVVFKHPLDRADYIKRVVGLPGDTVQMVAGVLHIDGQPIGRQRIGDFVAPITPYNACRVERFRAKAPDGTPVCSYPQFRETLPGGRSYTVVDFGLMPQDTTQAVIVPEGSLFLMGDNRDNSQDSRFPAAPGGGIGLVPVENVVGRASFIAFSTDGTSSWINPVSWFTAARWHRIGNEL